jgi:hypothetical protein
MRTDRFNQLEPDAIEGLPEKSPAEIYEAAIRLSTAISLKRIADALEQTAKAFKGNFLKIYEA